MGVTMKMSLFFVILICFNCLANDCWETAGKVYGVNPLLLKAIAKVESDLYSDAININSDGTFDIGLMQINSFWLKELEKYKIDKQSLFDPCTNIHVGAWILSEAIFLYGETWEAVGSYNVGTSNKLWAKKKRLKYANLVYLNYINTAILQ
jgi:soluble lytic murein transglycosylase-like protein